MVDELLLDLLLLQAFSGWSRVQRVEDVLIGHPTRIPLNAHRGGAIVDSYKRKLSKKLDQEIVQIYSNPLLFLYTTKDKPKITNKADTYPQTGRNPD
jgi:hypothetical protein